MSDSLFRMFVLRKIEERGRDAGLPKVAFSSRKISTAGEDIYVANNLLNWLTNTSGFFLALPSNTFGVVIYPDGTSRNLEGGTYEAPPGTYSLQYVDKQERLDFTSPITELTSDGEQITVKVLFRYRVVNPLVALQIANPVETLIEQIEADVAQYIRMHDHTNIFSGFNNQNEINLLEFFIQRHKQRFLFSKAFAITGIELKDFAGDAEYVRLRREARLTNRAAELANQSRTQKDSSFSLSIFGSPNKKYAYDLFILMPFTLTLKPVYDDHIKKVAKENNLTVARADDFFSQNSIMHEVWSAIAQATIIIADCTGKNPNVFYEIGIAHTIGKPVILITQNQDDVPFDLRHIRYILYEYTPPGMVKFENSLTKTILEILKDGDTGIKV